MKKLISDLRSLWNYFIYLLFPPRCPSCDIVTGSRIHGHICDECREKFEKEFVTVCPVCNLKSEHCECSTDSLGSESDRSPYTNVHPVIFAGYYVGYDNDSVVSKLTYQMKRVSESSAKIVFARIIAQCVSRHLVLNKLVTSDFTVTYIPRSKEAFEEYEFDHMLYIAKDVAKMLGCRYESFFIRKGGTEQKELSGEERILNASKSIHLMPKILPHIRGSKIILIDDIITTGSTMRTAVSRLSFAGADTIIPATAMISAKKKKAD